jgi:histidinol phosphatase-like enzyme
VGLTLSGLFTDRDGTAIVDGSQYIVYKDKMFVLIEDVLQLCYVKDNAHEEKHVVL